MENSKLKEIYNPEGSDLRKTQLMMLDILDTTVKILKENNINFWLEGGTLLGAKRHGGFIPWDDDLDIDIDEKDYKKALNILEKELPKSLYLEVRGKDKNYRLKWAKIKDRNSILDEIGTRKLKERGVFIDIFKARRIGKNGYKTLFAIQKSKKDSHPIFIKILIEALIKIVSIISVFEKKRYFITDNMYIQYKFPLDTIYPLKEIEFENKKYPAPNDIEKYLVLHYGDWFKIPNADQIVQHSTKIIIK